MQFSSRKSSKSYPSSVNGPSEAKKGLHSWCKAVIQALTLLSQQLAKELRLSHIRNMADVATTGRVTDHIFTEKTDQQKHDTSSIAVKALEDCQYS
jgi:hypothetical protein